MHQSSKPSTPSLRSKGATGEHLAEEYLKEKGYTVLRRNFRFGREGEIDLIARDKETLVFIEVKSRTSLEYGVPEAAVTWKKQQVIRRTAQGYLYINKIHNQECRFDVIAIELFRKPVEVRHIINAF